MPAATPRTALSATGPSRLQRTDRPPNDVVISSMEIDTLIAERAPGPAAAGPPPGEPEILIEPRDGWRPIDLGELWRHRDLLLHMIRKNILARYVQSVLGVSWTLVQPVTTMIIFAIVFGRVAKIPVPGGIPYAPFAFCGIVPWTFFSTALSATSSTLVGNAALLNKVYFPRLILPLAELATKCVDLVIIFGVLLLVIACYGFQPRPEALVLVPLASLIAAAAALGLGLWLSVLALQYRDVAYSLAFLVQVLMYLSPVIYSTSMIVRALGPQLALVWGLNPMVGVVSAYRWSMLGLREEFALTFLVEAGLVSALLLVSGAFFFRRSERVFADVS